MQAARLRGNSSGNSKGRIGPAPALKRRIPKVTRQPRPYLISFSDGTRYNDRACESVLKMSADPEALP